MKYNLRNTRQRRDWYVKFVQKLKIVDNTTAVGYRIYDDDVEQTHWHSRCKIIKTEKVCKLCSFPLDYEETHINHCMTCAWKLGLRA